MAPRVDEDNDDDDEESTEPEIVSKEPPIRTRSLTRVKVAMAATAKAVTACVKKWANGFFMMCKHKVAKQAKATRPPTRLSTKTSIKT